MATCFLVVSGFTAHMGAWKTHYMIWKHWMSNGVTLKSSLSVQVAISQHRLSFMPWTEQKITNMWPLGHTKLKVDTACLFTLPWQRRRVPTWCLQYFVRVMDQIVLEGTTHENVFLAHILRIFDTKRLSLPSWLLDMRHWVFTIYVVSRYVHLMRSYMVDGREGEISVR